MISLVLQKLGISSTGRGRSHHRRTVNTEAAADGRTSPVDITAMLPSTYMHPLYQFRTEIACHQLRSVTEAAVRPVSLNSVITVY